MRVRCCAVRNSGMIIDTHTHIYSEEFDGDKADVIARAKAVGVERILLPNINKDSIERIDAMCVDYPEICRPMIGLHPEDVSQQYSADLDAMENLLRERQDYYCAIGEVGLDYYWDTSKKKEQKEVFRRQIEWSIAYHLPLSIHLRAAFDDGIALLSEYKDELPGGVFHCFEGTPEEALRLLSFPTFYLGVGGLVTFKKQSLPATLHASVPLSRIVIETDAPYLTPTPFRGKRNESAYLIHVIEKLSQLYRVTSEEVMKITTENAYSAFPKI